MKTGILLINLGTPNSPTVKDVRAYLRQFLSDPYVIDIHPIARWLLLNLFILPTRPKKSAHAYQKIWTAQGSPLLINSMALAKHAQQLLGEQYQVVLGMRYGKPSIASAVSQLQACEKIVIVPLFPQYSLAATETAIQEALRYILAYPSFPRRRESTRMTLCSRMDSRLRGNDELKKPQIYVIRDFYAAPEFINIQAKLIAPLLTDIHWPTTKVLFSYHGLPERQINKVSQCTACDRQQSCPAISMSNQQCYRAQCYATSRALAGQLQLSVEQYITTFQSRLGRIPWIKPYTDEMLTELAQQGIQHLVIACPSFTSDCLETLEEIGIRAREQWLSLGGLSLHLAPCVNGNAAWLPPLLANLGYTDIHAM